MIEERIDKLIKKYQRYIYENQQKINKHSDNLVYRLNQGYENHIKTGAENIEELRKENELFAMFINSLKYAKEG